MSASDSNHRFRCLPGTTLGAAFVLFTCAPVAGAVTPAEQAELDAAAAPQSSSRAAPTFSPREVICPVGVVPTTLYFSDFEADDGGWSGGGDAPWEHGAPVTGVLDDCDNVDEDEPAGAFSGSNVWATNLDGCYANSGTESLLSRTFDFSAISGPIAMTWWNWYEVFVPFDMAEMRANGDILFEVTTTTPTVDYVQETVDLSAYAGSSGVTLDFRLFATTVVNRAGWYIDDVKITYCDTSQAPEIPTLGHWSLAGLLLLMLATGGFMLRRARGGQS